jgi:subtilase family serine protease
LATHHVRDAVVNGQAKLQGPLSPAQSLKLTIMLPLRNQEELDQLLQKFYDSQSPMYRNWLSVQEFTDAFGPALEDYEAVASFAEANGLKVTGRAPNRMVVDVEGSVADINRTFHVNMGVYQHPSEARTFYAPDREPTVDLNVQIWNISGLDNFAPPRPQARTAQAAEVHPLGGTGSGALSSFLGSDLRAAYYGGTALTGAGQTVGLFGLGYNLSDVELYYSTAGQTFNPSSVQNAFTTGAVNSCGTGCDDLEPIIDIVAALSMAPGATIIEYFGVNEIDTINSMAAANVAKQLSTSLVWLPADSSAAEPIFKEYAAQGQSFFSASGDSGSYSSTVAGWYPSDDPYVTAAGGTDLNTNGAGGSWKSEKAWTGSGGGISTNGIAIPSYQQLSGVIDSVNGGSTSLRNVPDVASEADDDYYCANGSCPTGYIAVGTSLSAPRWAGFMALVNQQAVNNGKATVGFLNPIIYGIGTGSNYDSDFHDITTGNNDNSGGGFNAVTGYDLVTGWGSPNGQNLINALAGSPGGFTLSGSPTSLAVVQGANGSTNITVADTNGFNGSVTLTASGLPSGVTAAFSPNPTASSSTLTLTATATAATGAATITVKGVSGSTTASTTITLTVNGVAAIAATPTFSPVAGTYTSIQTVTLSDSTTGAAINYTTDGTTPTANSTHYTGTGISVSATETIKAIAIATGYTNSAVNSATYIINLPSTADFTISTLTVTGTVSPGGSGDFTVTVTPINSTTFPAAVTLTASGLPTGATASFSPASIPAKATATTVALTILVPQTSAQTQTASGIGDNLTFRLTPLSLAIVLLPFAGRFRREGKWLTRTMSVLVLLGLSLAAAVGASGCGSPVKFPSGNQQQTYIVTVTGTEGTTSHSSTVTLTVQ